jgi:hypothetical protein
MSWLSMDTGVIESRPGKRGTVKKSEIVTDDFTDLLHKYFREIHNYLFFKEIEIVSTLLA